MTVVDDQLSSAVSELRREVDQLDPPPFEPRRSGAPILLAVVLILGIGIVGYLAATSSTDGDGISVATQPETTEPALEATAGPTDDQPGEVPPTGDRLTQDDPSLGPDGLPAGQARSIGRSMSVTNAQSGEFFVPLPTAAAWHVDGVRLVVYRTGAADQAHLVINTLDPDDEPIELPFTPADIEQIYWHPLSSEQLLYTADADLMTFDTESGETTVVHRFSECDRVDSGVVPVPPADDGTMSLLCHAGTGTSLVAFDLATGEERRRATTSDTAAFPSPSGDVFVRWNADGSASVLDRALTETGVVLDLANNGFGFVADEGGRDWVATTLFDGPAVGSLVLFAVDGSDAPVVIIGPERGDLYPPSGTHISTSGTRIAISIEGPDDGSLAGRVTLLDLRTSFIDPVRQTISHQSQGLHGYWSSPFVSLSSWGVFAYASDRGRDAVDTFVASFVDPTESGD